MNMSVFWDVAPCKFAEIDRRSRRAYCFHHQGGHRPKQLSEALYWGWKYEHRQAEGPVKAQWRWRIGKGNYTPQGQRIWTESSESSDWQVIFRHCAFPHPEFDFKGTKFLLICSPMQKKMRKRRRSGSRAKKNYHTSSYFFIGVKLLWR